MEKNSTIYVMTTDLKYKYQLICLPNPAHIYDFVYIPQNRKLITYIHSYQENQKKIDIYDISDSKSISLKMNYLDKYLGLIHGTNG